MSLTLFDNIGTDITPELEKKIKTFVGCLKKYSFNNPVRSKKIEMGMHITGTDVRAMVRYCRRMDYPIGSCSKGYFWINSKEELEKTIAHLNERKSSLERTIMEMQKIRLYINNSPHQTVI